MSPRDTRELISKVFGVSDDRVRDDLAFGDIPEWDSLNHVELMLALEERLGVQISAEQMVELSTVEAIVEFATR